MRFPSITTILGILFALYIAHSMLIMGQLFMKLKCSDVPCFETFLLKKPRMQLALFISINSNPISNEVKKIYQSENFDYSNEFRHEIEIDVPLKTRRNGTLYMQVVLAKRGEPLEWKSLRREGPTVIHTVCLTNYVVPRAKTFNLLGDTNKKTAANAANKKSTAENFNKKKMRSLEPVTHIMSNVHVGLLTDNFSLSTQDVPPEMARLIRVNNYNQILPILITDNFNIRIKDLVQVTRNTTEFKMQFVYKPIGIGKFRLILMTDHTLRMIENMGFSAKDLDDMKGLFSDTNVILLCLTVLVASLHVLFDFLSFKNDVSFWRNKKSYEGLSTRTTLWRAFSQIVIFLSLLDENASLLVVIPCGIASVIELWKSKKILKMNIGWKDMKRFILSSSSSSSSSSTFSNNSNRVNASALAERKTEEFDKEGMKYLSYLLYPLCISGAIYSLIYQPHRSWYSWTLSSLVNGVYAFGFLFMLPQLFINYKLKSVAALPWRAFMYKAFNTFIDDFFAFIITMPTAHRVACLRDDVVFIVYLYQRWLYPVDQNRIDESIAAMINADKAAENSQGYVENELKKQK